MRNLLSCGVRLAAVCDPDPRQVQRARRDALRRGGEETKSAKSYGDYRRLLDNAASFDAVVIGTPDHWHAPLCKAFIAAGKHVYCEKPLTHSVAEARELRELVRRSKVVTQMGNQGSASASMRRCTELVRAGALGQVREIYDWGIGVAASEGNAPGVDPIPKGFNWDLWVGPSATRPFVKDTYHPQKWRRWWDFGNGGLADFWCHAFNMPMRALDLGYPDRLVVNLRDGNEVPGKAAVEFHFPAHGSLAPLVFYWQGEGRPPAALIQPVIDAKKLPTGGLVIVGDKGSIYTSHWNTEGLIRLAGEPRLKERPAPSGHAGHSPEPAAGEGARAGIRRRLPRPRQNLLRLQRRRQAYGDWAGGRTGGPRPQGPRLGRREDARPQCPRNGPLRPHGLPQEVARVAFHF